ncbi:MAG: putative Ig domain-containing protein [Thermoplasmata archaeon]
MVPHMRKLPALLLALLLSAPLFLPGSEPLSFEGGSSEVMVVLDTPSFEASASVSVPAGFYAANATLLVSGLPAVNDPLAYPENVVLSINGTEIWGFGGNSFGSLGRQDRFFNGKKSAELTFGEGGGASVAYVRLPKNAVVESAVMDLWSGPKLSPHEIMTLPGDYSISGDGDFNGDGYKDIVMGNPFIAYGEARIHLGGTIMNTLPDIILIGENQFDRFGYSVSSAGDFNGDGYDDIIVGAPWYGDLTTCQTGKAYLFLGGSRLDTQPYWSISGVNAFDQLGMTVASAGDINGDGYDDILIGTNVNKNGAVVIVLGGPDRSKIVVWTLFGGEEGFRFGTSLSGCGDLNNDGYDDIIVGDPFKHIPPDYSGEVYIFFGGPNMNREPDVIFTSSCRLAYLGISVGCAGDLNLDGYDDVIVLAVNHNGSIPGAAYVLFGGESMDNITDITFTGVHTMYSASYRSVGCAGDVNSDGVDDALVGAFYDSRAGKEAGAVFIYYGGMDIDTAPDWTFLGEADGDLFGFIAVGGGDINGDGYPEIIISAPGNDASGPDAGRIYVYTLVNLSIEGILDAGIKIGPKNIWSCAGIFSFGSKAGIKDFASALSDYLRTAEPTTTDDFGNEFVDVPLLASAKSEGVLRITNLSITYRCDFRTPNFALPLNRYLRDHQGNAGPDGNITVPIRVTSTSPGRVRLSGLEMTRDLPPVQVGELEGIALDEETAVVTLVDLYNYFEDDIDPDTKLSFAVVSSTNRSAVRLWISGNRYLSADAMTGEKSANWTGTVEAVLACMDGWGQRTNSRPFKITVRNVEDPPVIISEPVRTGTTGVPYYYNVTANDGDGDVLEFSLVRAPENMSIGPLLGNITWVPPRKGIYEVSVQVSDGKFSDSQGYNISVPNSPPRIIDEEAPQALLGANYTYAIPAVDDDGDALSFALLTEMENMSLNSSTGVLSWRPEEIGEFPVSLNVSDGEANITHNFTIVVVRGNRAPLFKSRPVTEGVRHVPYRYDVRVEDPDGDQITLTLLSGPRNMTLDNSTGQLIWVPDETGNFSVRLLASDGRGGEALQEFVVHVADKVLPIVEFIKPAEGQRVTGRMNVSGKTVRGTLEVVRVQIRIDSGDWLEASGNHSWSCTVDTTELKNGRHTIQARAYDGYDFSLPVNRTIIVDNPAERGGVNLWLGAVLVLLAAASAAVLLWGKRHKSR